VYELKCIIEDLLDATENLTDGLLNLLKPSLEPLLADLGLPLLGPV